MLATMTGTASDDGFEQIVSIVPELIDGVGRLAHIETASCFGDVAQVPQHVRACPY